MSVDLSHVLQIVSPAGIQLYGTGNQGVFASTSTVPQVVDKLWLYLFARAGAAAETVRHSAGTAPPFHHLLDPATPASQFSVIYENMMRGVINSGAACRVVVGYWSYTTPGDRTTLMGIGFYADSNHIWHCFVIDSITGGAPYVSQYDNATVLLSNVVHRMKIRIDGPTKTITWYIDKAEVGSFTPAAPLERMGSAANSTGPEAMFGAFVPALGNTAVAGYAGSLPLQRFIVRSTDTITPGGGGSHMSVGVVG